MSAMGRIAPVTPWNAVIAHTIDIAEQYMDAFGLSREMWQPIAHSSAITGRRFSRITVIRPHWRSTPAEIALFDNEIAPFWMTQLDIGGVLKII